MTSWPVTWIGSSLQCLGVPTTSETIAIMRAWQKSTPLPPLSNNPLGMPRGTNGASSYISTGYALFTSMDKFYTALRSLAKSAAGKDLVNAFMQDSPAPAVWRVVSSLGWPGSATETDYPSGVLDLTSQSYRDSVQASEKAARKTSGQPGASPVTKSSVLRQARSLYEVSQSISDARQATAEMIRRHGKDGR